MVDYINSPWIIFVLGASFAGVVFHWSLYKSFKDGRLQPRDFILMRLKELLEDGEDTSYLVIQVNASVEYVQFRKIEGRYLQYAQPLVEWFEKYAESTKSLSSENGCKHWIGDDFDANYHGKVIYVDFEDYKSAAKFANQVLSNVYNVGEEDLVRLKLNLV